MSGYQTRVRICAHMTEQHLSARRMAEQLGWTDGYLTAVLGGRGPLTVSQVSSIASVLHVDPLELTDTPLQLSRLVDEQPDWTLERTLATA